MNNYFAPGCGLMIYKPLLSDKIYNTLKMIDDKIDIHLTCCQHDPNLQSMTTIVNVCPGCDRRYRSLYDNIKTVSLWEILDNYDDFNFPNYHNLKMTIHDACPTRTEPRVYESIRSLLKKMNIDIIETKNNKDKSICCGDSFFGKVSDDKLFEIIKKRADEMPCDNVVVYCTSCIKTLKLGEKNPRFILDLLFGEETNTDFIDLKKWHDALDLFIKDH